MAQHDYNIVNDTGQNVRGDINLVLDAIMSANSGAAPPATLFAGTLWFDTSPEAAGILKLWDGGNWHVIAAGTEYVPLTGGNILGDLEVTGVFSNPDWNKRKGNYAAPTAPASPTLGLLWYDTASGVTKVYNGGWVPLVNTSSPEFTQMVTVTGAVTELRLVAAGETRKWQSDPTNDWFNYFNAAGAHTAAISDAGDLWVSAIGWLTTVLAGKQAALGFTAVRQADGNQITVGYSTPHLWINSVDQGVIRLGNPAPVMARQDIGSYSLCTSIDGTLVGNGAYASANLRYGYRDDPGGPVISSGTWRNMGGTIGDGGRTVFQRIA